MSRCRSKSGAARRPRAAAAVVGSGFFMAAGPAFLWEAFQACVYVYPHLEPRPGALGAAINENAPSARDCLPAVRRTPKAPVPALRPALSSSRLLKSTITRAAATRPLPRPSGNAALRLFTTTSTVTLHKPPPCRHRGRSSPHGDAELPLIANSPLPGRRSWRFNHRLGTLSQ